MDRPQVVRVSFDRLASPRFGLHMVAGFFERKGMHAQHAGIARGCVIPRGENARRSGPKRLGSPGPEGQVVMQLECNDVERMISQDQLPCVGRAKDVA